MKLISSLGYVTRTDDVCNKRLWTIDPIAKKIYDLHIVQAYSIDKVGKELGMDCLLVDAIITGIRSHYKISFTKQIKNRISMNILAPIQFRKLIQKGVLK